ncbi:hypothetical protein [Streptomyces sp. NPDC001880]
MTVPSYGVSAKSTAAGDRDARDCAGSANRSGRRLQQAVGEEPGREVRDVVRALQDELSDIYAFAKVIPIRVPPCGGRSFSGTHSAVAADGAPPPPMAGPYTPRS